MFYRTTFTAACAAAVLAFAATTTFAFSPDDTQITASVHGELRAQGFDVANFDALTMAQISLIKGLLEESSNAQMIKGALSGDCCGNIALDVDGLSSPTN
jgi:hypothetical protein